MELATLPDAAQVEQKALTELERARALVITTDEAYQEAGSFLRGLKALQKEIDETFDGAIKAAHLAHKAVVAAKAKHTEPIVEAERICKGKVAQYQIEAQARAEAERVRLEAEAKAKAEAQALAAAVAAEASGDKELAEAIISEPVTTAPVKAPAPVKAQGVSVRDKHCAEVTDLGALSAAIAAGKAPITLVAVDETALRRYAEATRGAMTVPGVRFFKTQVTTVRA